ncbi:hypothetical protein [Chryseobacterium sp. ON_d1]|uniref:hypothetical protein n=1 Tax=Chryseobacterium sp. ON_d1 TaxID=2583211 RepID=UPI0011579C79|nr:hypothetical protein [Chryseobacterium sp. ON_d1]GEJ44011.1 hypothetical protein CRS_06190 [Chryseobacterium sp. ON_d1]
MDETKIELSDPVDDKYLIDQYFNLIIKKELNIDVDVSNEYIIAQNIVSKKLILVNTFSDAIMGNPQLYLLLRSLLYNVNTLCLTKRQIMMALENK